jgi:hypothetical protein
MAGKEADRPPGKNASRFAASWSAVSQGDLGLKAGIRNQAGQLVFRPILGWVTVTERQIGTEEVSNQLHPVMLNDVGYPTLGMFIDGCVGVFPKDMSDEQASEFSRRWTDTNETQSPLTGAMVN